jgi:predicted transcriptional regulator
MDWKKLIDELSDLGVTQQQIAKACGVSQASVSDLKIGNAQQPRYSFGAALVDLHRKASRKRTLTSGTVRPQPQSAMPRPTTAG